MLRKESVISVADNTWAKKAKIIGIPHGSRKKNASIWDYVVVAIQEASPTGSIRKGQVVRALIVRTRKELGRKDGTYVRFGDNACVIVEITEKGEVKPKGKRIFGPVAREIRDMGLKVITNIAEEVI